MFTTTHDAPQPTLNNRMTGGSPLSSPRPETRAEQWIGWVGCVMMVLCVAWVGLGAEGVGYHDELGHLLVARDAWHAPRLIFNPWGRTINTLFFMPVAWLPLGAARVWASIMVAASAWLAWRLGRREGLALACLVPWLMLVQRWTLENGWMALTLPPFLLVAMLAATAGRAGWWKAAALLVGLLPLVRHEAVILCGFFGLLMLVRRQWLAAFLVGVPLALNWLLAWTLFGDNPLIVFYEPHGPSVYGSAPPWHFIEGIRNGCGKPVFLMALFGGVQILKRRKLSIILLFGGLYVATHIVLFWLGAFATGGYVVFLLPLIPLLALLAAEGMHWLCREVARNLWLGWRPPALSVPRLRRLLLVAFCGLAVVPVRNVQRPAILPHEEAINQAIEYLRGHGLESQPIVACHVWFFYYMPRPIPHIDRELWGNHENPERFPAGTLVLWESNYSDTWNLPRKVLDGPRFQKVWEAATNQAAIYRKLP